MSYVALYRAYRPQKFNEVAGQKHIVLTLENAIKQDKVAHAYLFSGPRGTGKTTLAKIMAKVLNCTDLDGIEPCNECENCKSIMQGSNPDVIEMDAASNNGVDEIRDIRDKINLMPAFGKYKVYIIDEVHMLSNGAFNALLKTLEEPPRNVIFILATTEPQKIPATILSRCQRFDFLSISSKEIYEKLKQVAMLEKIKVTDEALAYISEICEGGMRDALSVLDQCVSYQGENTINLSDVLDISGNVSKEDLLDLLTACEANKQDQTLSIVNKIIDEGKEIPKITTDLVMILKDTLLFKANYEQKSLYKNEKFITFSNNINKQMIYGWLNILNEVLNNIKYTNQKRAYLELGLLKMADQELNDYSSLISRVDLIEKKLDKGIALSGNLEEVTEPIIVPKTVQEVENPPNNDLEKVEESEKPSKILPTVELDSTFIAVKDIEEILYVASKKYKEPLQERVNYLQDRNLNVPIFTSIFGKGTVGAVSKDKAIFVLEDDARCNRLMKADNYKKMLEVINNKGELIKDFICISNTTWSEILKDYKAKYREDNKNPKLKDIPIMVKRFIEEEQEQNEIITKAFDLFGEDKVKIIKEN